MRVFKKKRVFRTHVRRSSFYWNTKLGDDRINELTTWVASLSEEDAGKLEDLLNDVRREVWDEAQRED